MKQKNVTDSLRKSKRINKIKLRLCPEAKYWKKLPTFHEPRMSSKQWTAAKHSTTNHTEFWRKVIASMLGNPQQKVFYLTTKQSMLSRNKQLASGL